MPSKEELDAYVASVDAILHRRFRLDVTVMEFDAEDAEASIAWGKSPEDVVQWWAEKYGIEDVNEWIDAMRPAATALLRGIADDTVSDEDAVRLVEAMLDAPGPRDDAL